MHASTSFSLFVIGQTAKRNHDISRSVRSTCTNTRRRLNISNWNIFSLYYPGSERQKKTKKQASKQTNKQTNKQTRIFLVRSLSSCHRILNFVHLFINTYIHLHVHIYMHKCINTLSPAHLLTSFRASISAPLCSRRATTSLRPQ